MGIRVGNGSCVAFVKLTLGVTEAWWNPRYVWNHADLLSLKRLPSPIKGSIIITNEGNVGHMGIVEKVSEYVIMIVEQNFYKSYVSRREIPINYNKIVGYLQPL